MSTQPHRSEAEPRWLDDDERETWLSLASLLIRLPAALDAHLLRDAGMSHFEYQVLAGLSESAERTMRMSVLAALADGSLSRLSQVVSRLERRGWVTRSPDPTDGRYTLATLTDEGWQRVVETAPGHVETVRRLVFDPLTSAQQRHLGAICRRIGAAVDPADACGVARLTAARTTGQYRTEDPGSLSRQGEARRRTASTTR